MSERSHGNWIRLYLEENNSKILFNLGSKVRRQYLDALQTLSLSLSRQVTQYDIYSMVVGTVMVLEVRGSWGVMLGCETDQTAQPDSAVYRTYNTSISENGKAQVSCGLTLSLCVPASCRAPVLAGH